MLPTRNSLKTACSERLILTFCISVVSFFVIFSFAMDKRNALPELSHREMKGLLGGWFTCCDNCDEIDEYFDECYHTQTLPSDPDCDEDLTKCIRNTLVTASCEPDQGNAYGCDTSKDYPETPSLHQDIYSIAENCTYSNSNWNVHRTIYYGCDFSSLKVCDDYTYVKACNQSGECNGEWLDDYDKGLPKLACAICS